MMETEPEVIVSYDLNGNILPYKIRVQDENQSLIAFKIDRVLFVDEDKRESVLKYRCELTLQERKKYADLFFHKLTMKWKLKM